MCNTILSQYYQRLYAQDPTDDQGQHSFLAEVTLPHITPAQLEALNAPLMPEEIEGVIPDHKAPGPDGFTPEFYKLLRVELLDPLYNMYRHLWNEGRYFPTANEAYIRLLPKKGKDPTAPGSYRPISLINLDAKILSKVIADRIALVLPDLIHPSQSGFVKGCSAVANIRKTMMALDYAIVPWLFKVLNKVGFTGRIIQLLRAMYASPTARICTPGFLSPPFRLHKGTRQGCPLSPLLFNLALEPLVRLLDSHPDIHGIPIHDRSLRAS